MDSRPVDPLINDVTDYGDQSDFEREVHMGRIGKRVGCKQTMPVRGDQWNDKYPSDRVISKSLGTQFIL